MAKRSNRANGTATAPPLRLEWRSPAELAENPRNWRTHPEAQTAALSDALAEVGWAGACLYNETTGRLIDGHARRNLAVAQGAAAVPVLIGSWTEAQEATILATLDPLAGMATADAAQLEALLRDVRSEAPALRAMLGELAAAHPVPVAAPPVELEDGDEDADTLDLLFKAPFPWFGGKMRVAKLVWSRFAGCQGYVEPFFGSGAVLLNRPLPIDGTETINDFDALVCNFWRAVQQAPDDVATFTDWPVNESDLHARHAWLVARKDTLQAKLEGDPDHYDAKIAGWWAWGMACWIGSGFCSGNGPWQVVEGQLVHLSDEGRGVKRQRVHLSDEGRGVNRQLVHLSDEGQGVNRQLVHLSDEGQAGLGERGLLEWIRALSERLARVRVCCGDWTRVCGGGTGDALQHFFSGGKPCGVFLDPPYSAEADRDGTLYRAESLTVAHAVRKWAIAHGDDPRLRIALCGYDGEHAMPPSWECVKWKTQSGYAQTGRDAGSRGKVNRFRERVWFSPHCPRPEKAAGA